MAEKTLRAPQPAVSPVVAEPTASVQDFGSNAAIAGGLRAEPAQAEKVAPQDRAAEIGSPAKASPVEAYQERLTKEYAPLLETLKTAKTQEEREAAALAVASWNRANMVAQPDVQAYLARTDVPAEEKTATMNALALEVARSEFLAGWAAKGGVDAKQGTWETNGDNSGPFPTHYQKQVKTLGTGDGAAWCTSFAGSALLGAGLQTNPGAKLDATSMFWSGSRLDQWARTGQSNEGKVVNPEGSRVVDSKTGGRHDTSYGQLTAALKGAKDKKTGEIKGAEGIVDQQVDKKGGFMPGDVIVLDAGNAVAGSSHTVMVDRYDPQTRTLYTIEGNKNQKVTSTAIDLKDPKNAAMIASRTRMGAEMFMTPETRAKAAGPKQDAGPDAISADALLGRARGTNAQLAGVMQGQGWIAAGADDTVYAQAGNARETLNSGTR